jgi:hypothetical protein
MKPLRRAAARRSTCALADVPAGSGGGPRRRAPKRGPPDYHDGELTNRRPRRAAMVAKPGARRQSSRGGRMVTISNFAASRLPTRFLRDIFGHAALGFTSTCCGHSGWPWRAAAARSHPGPGHSLRVCSSWTRHLQRTRGPCRCDRAGVGQGPTRRRPARMPQISRRGLCPASCPVIAVTAVKAQSGACHTHFHGETF